MNNIKSSQLINKIIDNEKQELTCDMFEIFEQKKAKDLAKRQNEIADTIKTGELNYPFETPNEQIGKSGGGFTKFGGLLIGISGFMLMSINNRVLSPFATIEEMNDFLEKNQSDADA